VPILKVPILKVMEMRSLAEIVQLRTSACRDAAYVLPAVAADEYAGGAGDPRLAHIEECLRCQAELSAYRRLIAQLRDLRQDLESPPEGALTGLLQAITGEPVPNTHWVRAAYLGGITVATAAAGAAGVLVWMSRRRPGMAQAS
jgi:hypothetical protein